MIRQTLKIAKPMVAYANVIGDTTLRQEVDYTESELRKSRDTVLENKCQIIHDRSNTHAAALVPYGITAGMITALQTAIDDYHSVIAGPRSAIALRKTQTLQLNEKLNAANIILTGQIDQLTELFKDTNPTYYNDYFNARIIVNLGAGQFTFAGTVLAGETITVFSNANDDAESFEISNTGTADFKVGRGANGTDMGNALGLNAGLVIINTALELGNSGNTYLNIQNTGAVDGTYKVVRL